jgi:beta-barrel assembly-enhancing protease
MTKQWNVLRLATLAAALSLTGVTVAQQAPANSPNANPSAPSADPQKQTPTAPSAQPAPGSTPSADKGTDVAGNPVGADQTVPSTPTEATDKADKDKKDKEDKKDKKHKKSEDDVDEVGNRNIGGKGLGNWYSVDKEVRIGKSYAQQVEHTVKLIDDPVINEYVNRVGQNLVRNSDAKVPFTIKVVDDDSINAFALPGGFFYVNSGLILAADNESELAGVMAHEIAHVAAHHAMRQMTRANYAQIGMIPIMIMGGGIGYAAYEAANLALPMTFMKFSRSFEAEADYLGVQYLYKTGYDPQSFVDFFEKIEAQEKKKPGSLAKAFSSHPQTPDRIEASQKEIAKVLPSKAQYVVTTSEFDTVKARLAAIENKRKLRDDKDNNKPTLRRASQTDTNDKTNGKSGDDDRPTLHKRDQ